MAAGGLIVASGVYGATLGGHWQAALDWSAQRAMETAAAAGLDIEAVSFEGLSELEEADLLPLVLMREGYGNEAFDVGAVKASLLENPWVRDADVRRLFPNRLVVAIAERKPVALLQNNGLHLIDEEGNWLGLLEGERYAALPVIAGTGAVEASSELKRLMRAASWMPSKPRGAVRVGERRWNMVLEDGSVLRLPSVRPGAALARLKALDESAVVLTSAMLSGEPIVVDLRYADQVTFAVLNAASEPKGQDIMGAPS